MDIFPTALSRIRTYSLMQTGNACSILLFHELKQMEIIMKFIQKSEECVAPKTYLARV